MAFLVLLLVPAQPLDAMPSNQSIRHYLTARSKIALGMRPSWLLQPT
jgi:hypothetical protein